MLTVSVSVRGAAAARTQLPSFPHLRRSAAFSIKMSATPTNQIIEHIVLFKINPSSTDPSAVSAMLSNLNSLSSLPSVLHISAGPIISSTRSSFTHLLHSRYSSKPDLSAYSDHPSHLSVVSSYVKPIVDDVMALDWVADDFSGPVKLSPGSAARFTLLKLKDGVGEDGKEEVMRVVRGVKEKFGAVKQLTVGENFSPGRAKGYSIGSVAVFDGVEGLASLDEERERERANEEKDKVREFLDGVLVLDYVIPAAVQSAACL